MEERKFDKSKWGEGPWQDEPDRVEWRSHGFPCLVLRGPAGNLCGYVGVPKEHPWYGKGIDDVDVAVHGGLSYADSCEANAAICHVPLPGESDNVWWLGFDFAHFGDVMPEVEGLLGPIQKDRPPIQVDQEIQIIRSYKTVSYAKAEVERLAEQVNAAK